MFRTIDRKGPMQTETLVIGGGLTGCATAYYLARGGTDVALVERRDLNMQASGNNAGSIHAQIPHDPFVRHGDEWARIYAPTIPLMIDSIRMWAGLGAELGADLEVATPGGLLVAETEAQMREVERKTALERAHGLPVELLDREALMRLASYVSDRMVGGSFCPIEGKANPLVATPAFARAAERHGARILRRTEVRGIVPGRGGFSVATTAGELRCARIVNCAGADAGDVARLVGIDLPIERHPIQVNVTEPAPPLVRHLVYFAGEKLTLKQTPVGALLIGGGWPSRAGPTTGRLSADPCSIRANLAVARHVVPDLGSVRLLRTWPAIVNGTADWKPIIGEVPRVPGFYLAMFPWMGFTAGPIAARLIADIASGRDPGVDLSAFSTARYA
jgi:glycine/D-amino acid oxidase-like deaminating enzyme